MQQLRWTLQTLQLTGLRIAAFTRLPSDALQYQGPPEVLDCRVHTKLNSGVKQTAPTADLHDSQQVRAHWLRHVRRTHTASKAFKILVRIARQ
jgi:hypothetical protein